MMNLVVSKINNSISLDYNTISNIDNDLFSIIPSNVMNFYWYNTYGEIQYYDGTMEMIEELGIYQKLYDVYEEEFDRIKNEKIELEKKQKEDEELQRQEKEEYEKNRDYLEELRFIRNRKLYESDWTQLTDSPLSEEQKELWRIYRQELRDLPSIVEDPKPLVLDSNHSDWPIFEPSTSP